MVDFSESRYGGILSGPRTLGMGHSWHSVDSFKEKVHSASAVSEYKTTDHGRSVMRIFMVSCKFGVPNCVQTFKDTMTTRIHDSGNRIMGGQAPAVVCTMS